MTMELNTGFDGIETSRGVDTLQLKESKTPKQSVQPEPVSTQKPQESTAKIPVENWKTQSFNSVKEPGKKQETGSQEAQKRNADRPEQKPKFEAGNQLDFVKSTLDKLNSKSLKISIPPGSMLQIEIINQQTGETIQEIPPVKFDLNKLVIPKDEWTAITELA